MTTNELQRIEALERRVDELEEVFTPPIPSEEELLRETAKESEINRKIAANLAQKQRDDLLLRFFLAAMQGDWADTDGLSADGDDEESARAYLEAARAALRVWEGREK